MRLPFKSPTPLRWENVYSEAEFYKAAVRVYTKPLFHWRKALHTSTDGSTLYQLAGHGLRGLDRVHNALSREEFHFRPSVGLGYSFNGKPRTLYIPPWQERIVDLLLYRTLNQRLHRWFSPHSYAYRDHSYGLDSCQAQIAKLIRSSTKQLYLVKRDISDYFASINHQILLRQLAQHIEPEDYLFKLVRQRIQFEYQDESGSHQAEVGIPFGCASACLFANVYLTKMDRTIARIPGIHYFRYADDLLLLAEEREAALLARDLSSEMLAELQLTSKASHEADFVLCRQAVAESGFKAVTGFRHLGLLFEADGNVLLSRDKLRKIENLFRFAFRRKRRSWRKIQDPMERARTLTAIAAETLEQGVRNVGIIDYYLRHVTDARQLQRLDRWLAEEVLSLVFGGHKKGHFAKLSFKGLRAMGLPSLMHRQRLMIHGHTETSFFVWQRQKIERASWGTVARLGRVGSAAQTSLRAQKQRLNPARGRGRPSVDGCYGITCR